MVGPRGGSDELAPESDDPWSGGVRFVRGPRRLGGGSLVAAGASSGGGPAPSRFTGPSDAEPNDVSDLIALVGLGAGFGERLVATVVADWTTRLRKRRPEVAEAMPRLHAALYGRVFAALRSWLGEPQLLLELEMTGGDDRRSLTRIGRAVHVKLPFAWLLDVWARDLTTVQGRFCLNAKPGGTAGGEHWELAAVAPDLRTNERIDVRISPAPGA